MQLKVKALEFNQQYLKKRRRRRRRKRGRKKEEKANERTVLLTSHLYWLPKRVW